jgi:hypothetical protein
MALRRGDFGLEGIGKNTDLIPIHKPFINWMSIRKVTGQVKNYSKAWMAFQKELEEKKL